MGIEYWITAVHYENRHIEEVQAWYRNDAAFNPVPKHYSRAKMVNLVQSGLVTVFTAPPDGNAPPRRRGAKVEVFDVDNALYLRSIDDGIPQNNLEALPRY